MRGFSGFHTLSNWHITLKAGMLKISYNHIENKEHLGRSPCLPKVSQQSGEV